MSALSVFRSPERQGRYGLWPGLAFVFRQQAAGAQQRGEASAALAQLIESTLFDDATLIEEQHEIGVANRGKAVGDDEGRAVLSQRIHGGLHAGFRFHVQRAGRLVENQNGGILQDGAGDGDALAFTAGQAVTAFADLRQVAGNTAVDEIRCRSCCRRFHHFRIGCRFATEGECFRG